MWKRILGVMFILILATPAMAGTVTPQDFKVNTTRNLLNLCNADRNDPLYTAAIHFCEGYLVGAFHYYQASTKGPEAQKLVCFPDPPPSRNQALKMFLKWTAKHPRYNQEMPVETEFRFLIETWPCP